MHSANVIKRRIKRDPEILDIKRRKFFVHFVSKLAMSVFYSMFYKKILPKILPMENVRRKCDRYPNSTVYFH